VSEARALVRRILDFGERLDAGEADADAVTPVFDEVRAVAPAASVEDQLALGRSLAVLEGAVRRRLDDVGSALRQVGHARRAVSAFRSLRPHASAQRVRTKV
jgi:hypothetical protein